MNCDMNVSSLDKKEAQAMDKPRLNSQAPLGTQFLHFLKDNKPPFFNTSIITVATVSIATHLDVSSLEFEAVIL